MPIADVEMTKIGTLDHEEKNSLKNLEHPPGFDRMKGAISFLAECHPTGSQRAGNNNLQINCNNPETETFFIVNFLD